MSVFYKILLVMEQRINGDVEVGVVLVPIEAALSCKFFLVLYVGGV